MSELIVVHVDTLWWGASAGGEHYYGYLKCFDYPGTDLMENIQLEHPLSSDEARLLNKKDKARAGSGGYRKGTMSNRFSSEEDIIEVAREVWKEHLPEADLLVFKGVAMAEPRLVLEGPKKIKDAINRLVKKFEKLGEWGKSKANDKKKDAVCDEWYKIVGKYQ